MIIQPSDYDTTALFTAALDEYFVGDGAVYINKLGYDLNRACEREEYFINSLSYQVDNGFGDTEPYAGFDTYEPPAATFDIVYYDGPFTTYVNTVGTYTPGSDITFNVEALSASSPITSFNITVTISSAENAELTGTADVDDADGQADFTFSIPDTYVGTLYVSSLLTNISLQDIYYGYSLSPKTLSNVPDTLNLGVATSNTDIVGDLNLDGTIGAADQLAYLTTYAGYNHRLGAAKHFTVTLFTNSYHPAIQDNQVGFQLTPVTSDYTFKTTFAGDTYTGQAKSLSDLRVRAILTTGSADDLSVKDYNLGSLTINANGEFLTSNSNGGFLTIDNDATGPALVILQVKEALNDIIYLTANKLHGGAITAIDNSVTQFEPGDSLSFTVTASYTTAQPWSTHNQALNSTFKLEGYTNSEFTGDPVITYENPISSPDQNDVLLQFSVSVPNNIDQDLYFRSFWSVPRYANLVYPQQDPDSNVDMTAVGSISVSPIFYDLDDATETITVTFTPDAGITRSDYSFTLSAQDTRTGFSTNVITLAIADTSNNSWTFTRNAFLNQAPTDRIRVFFSIAEA